MHAWWLTRSELGCCLQTSDGEFGKIWKELQTWHRAISAVSLCIRHTCTATLSDLPTLPVSTNIDPSSHPEVQKQTLAQARTDTLKKTRQPARANAGDSFTHPSDERKTCQWIKEGEVGWKRGTVQRGNTERSKQRSRVDPLLTCLRAGGCQRAWEQTRMCATCGEDCATRGDLSTWTNTPQNTLRDSVTNKCHALFNLRLPSPYSSASSHAEDWVWLKPNYLNFEHS